MMERIRELMQKYEMTEAQLLAILAIGANRTELLDNMHGNKEAASLMHEFKLDIARTLEEEL